MQFTKTTRQSRLACQSIALAFLLFAFVCGSHMCQAQTFSASIAGTVKDQSGAVVSGAQVELQNMDTKDTRKVPSAADGSYKFNNLLPGTYQITVSAAGFNAFQQQNMLLRANTAATVDVTLQVGGTQQEVRVSSEALLVDTESANNSVTMDSALIEALPNNTRNPLNFVFALAGTTEGQGGMTSRSTSYDQNASVFGLSGGRTATSEILIDGAPSTAIDWGGLMVSPMQDSVQEQQVVQNEFDVQYERGGSGVVTLVTKSGSDAFHGEVYDYMRNDAFDANTWSNNFNGAPRGKFHRNQFGGNIGGALWRRHKLYFFAAYEGLRQPETDSSGLLTVPTAAERKGDFSHTYNPDGTLAVIYNPFSTHQVTDAKGHTYYTRDPFPNNQIPDGLWSKVGGNILNLFPLPNQPNTTPNDLNNYYKQGPGLTQNDKFDWRIDWNQSTIQHFFVRMSDRVRENNTPACFLCNGADEGATNDDHGFQVVVNDTLTPGSTWVFDIYGAYTRWWEGQTSIGYGVADASKIGLSPSYFQAPLLPLVNTANYMTLGSTYSSFDRYVRTLSTGIVNVTKEVGRHAVKFGFNFDVGMINNRQDSPGGFNFDRSLTSCDPQPSGPCKASNNGSDLTGNGIASMLLGVGNGGSSINMDPAMSQHTFGVYAQDQWRVTSRLTLTAGLRYENQRPATERHNRLAYFDPNVENPLSAAYGSPLRGAFEFAGVGGRGRFAWEPDNKDFGPRAGIAYRISDRIVARAGAGFFFAPTSAMLSFDQPGQFPGFSSQTNWVGTNGSGYVPTTTVDNPFPHGLSQPTGSALGAMTYVGDGASQIWAKGPHPVGNIYQWSGDFQYQIDSHSVAELGYMGSRGRKLLFGNPNFDLDQLPDKYLSIGDHLNDNVPNPFASVITDPNLYLAQPEIAYNELLRPFPEYTYLVQTRSTPGARSQFDALYAKYNHAFSGGLSLIATYQWSKTLDDGSEDFLGWTINDMWRDAYQPKLDYAISTHDQPQSFATAFVYQLPYGNVKRWGSTAPAVVNQVLGNWIVSGTVRITSGFPFPNPVAFSYNPLNNFGFPGGGLPNVVANPKPQHRTLTHWINAAAFQGLSQNTGQPLNCAQNADADGTPDQCGPFPFSYGNEPQRMTQIREAPTQNLDMAVGKVFGPERLRAELRGEFLNVFNHPIYGGSYNISNCIDCGDLGTVYGTRNDPRNIQISLKLTF
jgi:hypothetical protein